MTTTETKHEYGNGVTAYADDEGQVLRLVLKPGASMQINVSDDLAAEIMHIPHWGDDDDGNVVSVVDDEPTEIDGERLADALDRFMDAVDQSLSDVVLYEGNGYLIRQLIVAEAQS